MWGEEEMHHDVPERRKMFYAGNCALFVKVNRLNSGGKEKKKRKKRALIHFSLVCCSWTCCF